MRADECSALAAVEQLLQTAASVMAHRRKKRAHLDHCIGDRAAIYSTASASQFIEND
jgi:hypothetical protein